MRIRMGRSEIIERGLHGNWAKLRLGQYDYVLKPWLVFVAHELFYCYELIWV